MSQVARDAGLSRESLYKALSGERVPGFDTILKIAAQDDVEITHAFVTHTHPDHVGGRFSGVEIPGVSELLSKCKLKVVVHKTEADALKGLAPSDIIKAESGDKIHIGGLEIQLLHTPGHTPGSQCFLIDGRIVSGDTLFIDDDETGGNCVAERDGFGA